MVSAEHFGAWLAASCEACGVPLLVDDAETVRKVRSLLGGQNESS